MAAVVTLMCMEATQTAQSNTKKICTVSDCGNVQRRGTKCWKHRDAKETQQEPQAAPKKFTVVNSANGAHAFEVHGAGCSHLSRSRHTQNGTWDVTASKASDVVDAEVADFEAQDQGWAHSDFKVFGCAK